MIKKLDVLKNDVLVPIEVSTAFYRNLQECSSSLLEGMEDPKQALVNIEKANKDPKFKLSLNEFALTIIMNVLYEVETVARKNPKKYITQVEHEVKD